MIKIKNITKKYNNISVLKNISYEFKKGLHLLVGSSGKGKTTLLNILSGSDKKFQGTISVRGEILYFKDRDNLPGELTVKEVYYLFEISEETKIKEYFEVKNLFNKKIKKLSLGEIQLVILNMVLNSSYKVIVLDEPFSALSTKNLKMATELIEKKAKDRTIIISSHTVKEFKKYTLLDLDNYKKINISNDYERVRVINNKGFKIRYYLLYLKKTFFRKIIFLGVLISTAFNYFYINKYANDLINEYMADLDIKEGEIIEKVNDINELDEDVFGEIIKKISKFAYDYNGNYYNSRLYNYDIKIDEYYIDNGFAFSSFKYVERLLAEDEIVMGLNYGDFCNKNKIFNCDENYIKTILVNKKVDDFSYRIKDVFDNSETVILNNKRFNKIYQSNEYEEYYFDVKKENLELMFKIINNDDFLLSFDYIKIGENEETVRYRVEIDDSKNFDYNISHSNYIVCLEKGYNCLNYLNHFETLVAIDEFKDVNELDLEVISENLALDEIVVSSKLKEKLNKDAGDVINFYFDYKENILVIPVKIINYIESDKYIIYQNSSWSYLFFKNNVNFSEVDLMIKNIVVYENVKEGERLSDNPYKIVLDEMKKMVKDTKNILYVVNVCINVGSVIVLILIEVFNNKFKREYISYLKLLNGGRKFKKK